MNPEKQLEKAILQWLDVRGIYAVKVHSGKMVAAYGGRPSVMQLAPTGTPDIHCCSNGRAFYIEVKKDDVTARKWERIVDRYIETGATAKSNLPIIAQYEMHNKIIRAGGLVLLVGSIDELEYDLISLRLIPTPHSYVHSDNRRESAKEKSYDWLSQVGKISGSEKANGKRTPRRDTRTIASREEAEERGRKILEGSKEVRLDVADREAK